MSDIKEITCGYCGKSQERDLDGDIEKCRSCGKYLIVDSDFIENTWRITEDKFLKISDVDENDESIKVVETGDGIGKIKYPLREGTVVYVVKNDGSTKRWKVVQIWGLENGGIGHDLKLIEEDKEGNNIPKPLPMEVHQAVKTVEPGVIETNKTPPHWADASAKELLPLGKTPQPSAELQQVAFESSSERRPLASLLSLHENNMSKILIQKLWPFLRRYGLVIILFLFGYHLHAQAKQSRPFWNDEEGILFHYMGEKEAVTQMVTARWLMLSAITLGSVVYLGIMERFRYPKEEGD